MTSSAARTDATSTGNAALEASSPRPLERTTDIAERAARIAVIAFCLALGAATVWLLANAWWTRFTEPRSEPDREWIIALVALLPAASAVALLVVLITPVILRWVRPAWLYAPAVCFASAVLCPLSLLIER